MNEPMNYQIELTEQATADLRAIFTYIAYEIPQNRSVQNAQGQLDRLEASINSLAQFPERCSQYPYEPWKSRGLRLLPVDHYCIFYLTDNDKATVFILRVLFNSRDLRSIWTEETL